MMEGDLEGARRRDKEFQNRQARRVRWISTWHLIDDLNPARGEYRNTDGFNIQALPSPDGDGWIGRVSYRTSPIRWISTPFPGLVETKLATFDKLEELRPFAAEWEEAEISRLAAVEAEARAKQTEKEAEQARREAAERELLAQMNRGRLEWKRSINGNWYTEDRGTHLAIVPSRGWVGKWDISVKEHEKPWARIEAWPSHDVAWEAVERAAAKIHGWSRTKPAPSDDDDGVYISILDRSRRPQPSP
jgi:hypothetical protein